MPRTLEDLLASSDGRRFLRSNGIFTTPGEFTTRLGPPDRKELPPVFHLDIQRPIVYVAQQIYVDYRQSVISKVLSLQRLAAASELFPLLIWADTDRTGSDKLQTRFSFPLKNDRHTISLVSKGRSKDMESRFVTLDRDHLKKSMGRLETCVTHSVADKAKQSGAKSRFHKIRSLAKGDTDLTLSELNHRITRLLFRRRLGIDFASIFVSEIINQGMVTEAVNHCVNRIEAFIRVFNEGIGTLIASDVAPQVKPLPDDYLPLYYSCETDDKRIKLRQKKRGGDHLAVGKCKCGREYSFTMGGGSRSIEALAATKRWSLDVTLPVFLNDLISGVVAGKSSALYGIVLKEVLTKVMGKRPVPALVPVDLASGDHDPDRIDSLMYSYLTESFKTAFQISRPSGVTAHGNRIEQE